MILIIENHDFRSKTTLICNKYLKNLRFIEKIVKKRNTMILIIKNHDFFHNYFDT